MEPAFSAPASIPVYQEIRKRKSLLQSIRKAVAQAHTTGSRKPHTLPEIEHILQAWSAYKQEPSLYQRSSDPDIILQHAEEARIWLYQTIRNMEHMPLTLLLQTLRGAVEAVEVGNTARWSDGQRLLMVLSQPDLSTEKRLDFGFALVFERSWAVTPPPQWGWVYGWTVRRAADERATPEAVQRLKRCVRFDGNAVLSGLIFLVELSTVSGEQCPICFEEYVSSERSISETAEDYPVRTACGHVFGRACLKMWVGTGRRNGEFCPLCRKKIGFEFGANLPRRLGEMFERGAIKTLNPRLTRLKHSSDDVQLLVRALLDESVVIQYVIRHMVGTNVPRNWTAEEQKMIFHRWGNLVADIRKIGISEDIWLESMKSVADSRLCDDGHPVLM